MKLKKSETIGERINNSQVVRGWINMIRTAPIDIVIELKQNIEREVQSHRFLPELQQEFSKRLKTNE